MSAPAGHALPGGFARIAAPGPSRVGRPTRSRRTRGRAWSAWRTPARSTPGCCGSSPTTALWLEQPQNRDTAFRYQALLDEWRDVYRRRPADDLARDETSWACCAAGGAK